MADPVPQPPPLPEESRDLALVPSAAFLWRNRHWTLPVLATYPAMAAAGFAARAYSAHEALIGASAAAAGATWLAAPHKWDRKAEQWYARLTVAAAGGWLSAATWYGDSGPMLIALCAGCAAWGIPWWWHKRPRRLRGDAKTVAEWNKWWCYHAIGWGLAGSRVTAVTSRGVTLTLEVQLWAGKQSLQHIDTSVPLIESALRGTVRIGMIRTEAHRDDPSKVLLHLKRSDPLAGEVEWDAASLPMSVTEPAVLGVAEGGEPVRECLLTNIFINGASRSGKSNELSVMMAALTGVPDARVWLIDMKGGRHARPWMPALDWCATTTDEARLLLGTALAEVKARGMHAYDGEEQLRPTDEVPAIFVVIDEAHAVTSEMSGDTRCASLLGSVASMGMGLAVYVIVLTQYGALAESVRTEMTRSNLPLRLCFRTDRSSHGVFALGDSTKADPSLLRGKGTFLWRSGPDSPAEQARAPHMPHETVRRVAERHGALARLPLQLYAADSQAAYESRWHRLPDALRRLAPQWDPDSPAPPEAEMALPDIGDEAFTMAMRIEAEVADVPDVPLSELPYMTDGEIRSAMHRGRADFARLLAMAPDGGVPPRRLVKASGMSRSWVHSQLAELVSHGAVVKVQDGMYRAIPGADVVTAMSEIREAQSRLLAAARSA